MKSMILILKTQPHDFVSAIVYHSSVMVDNHGYKILSEKLFEKGNIMKTLKVKLSDYPSEFFPVKAVYKINRIEYCAVFESLKQAEQYFKNRFYPVEVIFC